MLDRGRPAASRTGTRTRRRVDERYGEQDPAEVAAELGQAADALADAFDGVTGDQWQRHRRAAATARASPSRPSPATSCTTRSTTCTTSAVARIAHPATRMVRTAGPPVDERGMPMPSSRPSTRSGARVHLVLMLALTFATGVIDAVGYLGLDRVFTGNMTGNVVILGMASSAPTAFRWPAHLLALGRFHDGCRSRWSGGPSGRGWPMVAVFAPCSGWSVLFSRLWRSPYT